MPQDPSGKRAGKVVVADDNAPLLETLCAVATSAFVLLDLATRRMASPSQAWIAALALTHGLVLYTRDTHFSAVPGLACL